MSRIVKSVLCGLFISQISTVATASSSAASSALAELSAHCKAAQSDIKAYGPCVIETNTKMLVRLEQSEKEFIALMAKCQAKFKGVKRAEALRNWCVTQESDRQKTSFSLKSISEALENQSAQSALFAQRNLTVSTRHNIVQKQIQALKVNAQSVARSEEQVKTTAETLRKSYKEATGKAF